MRVRMIVLWISCVAGIAALWSIVLMLNLAHDMMREVKK